MKHYKKGDRLRVFPSNRPSFEYVAETNSETDRNPHESNNHPGQACIRYQGHYYCGYRWEHIKTKKTIIIKYES